MFIISFLRKKQTIIYIIIVALIWSLWPISDILSTIKKDVINKQNKDAYIEFQMSLGQLERIKGINNIKDVDLGVVVSLEKGKNIRLFGSDELRENDLIVNPQKFVNYNIGDKINFLELNYDFYIVAKEAYERETNYINEQVLLNLTKDFDTHIYKVTLNDWSIVNKTIKDINFNSNSNQGLNIIIYNSDGGIYNYGEYILIYSLLIIILFGASLLILIYIIKVTFDKEQEKRYLYYCLGFNKGQLNRLILTKIFLILGIGTALFWLIFGVVSLII